MRVVDVTLTTGEKFHYENAVFEDYDSAWLVIHWTNSDSLLADSTVVIPTSTIKLAIQYDTFKQDARGYKGGRYGN